MHASWGLSYTLPVLSDAWESNCWYVLADHCNAPELDFITLEGTNPAECKAACISQTSFECFSFDWHSGWAMCWLSNGTMSTAPPYPLAGYSYYERFPCPGKFSSSSLAQIFVSIRSSSELCSLVENYWKIFRLASSGKAWQFQVRIHLRLSFEQRCRNQVVTVLLTIKILPQSHNQAPTCSNSVCLERSNVTCQIKQCQTNIHQKITDVSN